MCCVHCADDPKEAIAENLFNRSEDFKARRAKQIQTPDFPTTTIGSFPQTAGVHPCPACNLMYPTPISFQETNTSIIWVAQGSSRGADAHAVHVLREDMRAASHVVTGGVGFCMHAGEFVLKV
jgi:hypothetical protein